MLSNQIILSGLELKSIPGPTAAVQKEILFLKNYYYVIICLLGSSQKSLELLLIRTQRNKDQLPGRPCGFLLRESLQPMGDGQSIITPESDFSEQKVFISNLKLVLLQRIDFILSK